MWELQRELWDPNLQWFQKAFQVKLPIVAGAITPPHIPDESLAVLRKELMSYRFDALLGKWAHNIDELVCAMICKLTITLLICNNVINRTSICCGSSQVINSYDGRLENAFEHGTGSQA